MLAGPARAATLTRLVLSAAMSFPRNRMAAVVAALVSTPLKRLVPTCRAVPKWPVRRSMVRQWDDSMPDGELGRSGLGAECLRERHGHRGGMLTWQEIRCTNPQADSPKASPQTSSEPTGVRDAHRPDHQQRVARTGPVAPLHCDLLGGGLGAARCRWDPLGLGVRRPLRGDGRS